MSSYVTIEPTEFSNTRTNDKTLGVRIYDDCGNDYINLWESIPDDDIDVLAKIIEEGVDGDIKAMLEFVQEEQQGMFIGGEWYEWEKIKDTMAGL